jgi:hypothetical protein
LGFRLSFYQPSGLSPRRGAQKGIFFQKHFALVSLCASLSASVCRCHVDANCWGLLLLHFVW